MKAQNSPATHWLSSAVRVDIGIWFRDSVKVRVWV